MKALLLIFILSLGFKSTFSQEKVFDEAHIDSVINSLPDNIDSHYAMGCTVVNDKWYHSGALTWGTSSLLFKDINNVCFAITCNTLPTMKGSDEEMFKKMVEYMKELHEFLPNALKDIVVYPEINLFEKYKQHKE